MSARLDGSNILNPGLLRHQITWQQKSVIGQNASGEDIFAWTDFLTCRARVQSTAGRELTRIMQIWAEADFLIEQHFSRGLRDDMRISWYNEGEIIYLDVLNINDPENNERYLEVVTKTFVDTGFTA